MAKNDILSEIKDAEKYAKKLIDEANEYRNKRLSDARAQARDIVKQGEFDSVKSAQDALKSGEEQVYAEKDSLTKQGETDANSMIEKAQVNVGPAVDFLVQEFERAIYE